MIDQSVSDTSAQSRATLHEMNRPIRLGRLLKRHDQLVLALQKFSDTHQTWIEIRESDGTAVVTFGADGEGAASIAEAPVVVDTDSIGSVVGPVADFVGPWLSAVATQAHLNRSMGAEVLQLYRQQKVTASLAELLSETSEPEVVADMVTDAVARALPGSGVGFVDEVGRVLATSGERATFDRELKPAEPIIENSLELCVLGAPVVGADRRFGHLQVVRPGPDFTAAEAELLGTLGVIAASAMGRAVAHQRDLEVARKRSTELEDTVAKLQTELDLVTTKVLASVLFTDLVDSTRSQASVGDEAWARLIQTHNRQATTLVDECGGSIVDFAGDGFFAWFETPSQAVDCGRRNLEMVEALGLQSRAGVHVGEAQQRGVALSGMTVNTAARIMGSAEAGQLLVSGVTTDLLGDSEFSFEWVGELTLKGVPAPQRVLAVVRD